MLAKHGGEGEKIVITRGSTRTSVLILLFVLSLGTLLTPSYQNNQCVCGTRKTLLVLADFPEYPHLSSRAEITALFFSKVARYFHDVSYGKLTVVGNSTDWISLPKLYSQYVGTDLRAGIVSVAKDAFSSASQSFDFAAFDPVVLVLSYYPSLTGDFVPNYEHPIPTRAGGVSGFAVVEESRDWSAYARAFALSLGMWRLQGQLSGMATNDLAASGHGDMSAWSKTALGWINESQVLSENTPGTGRILTLDPVEDPGPDALALRISLGESAGEYWVEVRQPIGYDGNNLEQYGAIVSYAGPSNASIQLKKVLQPEIISQAIFLDPNWDLSIIALNVTQGRYRLLIGNAQDGIAAQGTIYAISRAQDAIRAAETENRFQTLDLAKTLQANAHVLFDQGNFHDADALAVSAQTTANAATVPQDYAQAAQLLTAAEVLKNQTSTVTSSHSSPLAQQAMVQLDIARRAFELGDFSLTKQAAQSSIDLFNRAKQMELIDTILAWLSNLALILPVIILAFALRYQLKRT